MPPPAVPSAAAGAHTLLVAQRRQRLAPLPPYHAGRYEHHAAGVHNQCRPEACRAHLLRAHLEYYHVQRGECYFGFAVETLLVTATGLRSMVAMATTVFKLAEKMVDESNDPAYAAAREDATKRRWLFFLITQSCLELIFGRLRQMSKHESGLRVCDFATNVRKLQDEAIARTGGHRELTSLTGFSMLPIARNKRLNEGAATLKPE